MANGKVLQAIVEIAGSVSPTLAKAVKETGDKLGKVNTKALAVGAAAAAGAVAVGKAAFEAGKYLTKLGDEYNQAINDVAAATGAAGKDLEGLADVVKNVYGDNFGESMGDVAAGVSEIYKQTGLTEEALAETTKAAYALSDTFGYDVTESARAAKAMMTNFGVSGEEAMNLIAAGAQNGLDFSGEMIDSINEYSVQFAKLGFSADDMFNIFQQGADSGAWNLDKVGDAIKEFSIRSIDGSKTTVEAFESLGFDADKMMGKFAKGGDGASEAFQTVISKLMNMKDEVKRDALGVSLFGTQWEDLGVEAMTALSNMEGGAYDAGDALSGIMDVKYNNIGDAFGAIKRKAEVSLLPLASTVANSVLSIMPTIEKLMDNLIPIIEEMGETIGPLITDIFADIGSMLGEFLPPILKIASVVAKQLIPPLVNIIGMVLPILIQLAQMLMPIIEFIAAELLPVAVQLIEQLLPPIMQVIEIVLPIVLDLLNTLMPILTMIIDAVLPVVVFLINLIAEAMKFLAPIIQFIADLFANSLRSAISGIQPYIEAVTGVFQNLIGFIKNVFAGNWSAAWDNIVGYFKSIWEGMKAIFKAPINWFIDGINLFIGGLNKLKIPDWVPVVGGKGINIPLIPKLATGGFTDGVSIAGEAGMEAVISFDTAYRDENIGYWMQSGKMLGVLDDVAASSGDTSLTAQAGKLMAMENFSLGQMTESTVIYYDFSGMTWAPQVEAGSDTDKNDILVALKKQASEFFDWLDEWIKQKEVGEYDRVGIY